MCRQLTLHVVRNRIAGSKRELLLEPRLKNSRVRHDCGNSAHSYRVQGSRNVIPARVDRQSWIRDPARSTKHLSGLGRNRRSSGSLVSYIRDVSYACADRSCKHSSRQRRCRDSAGRLTGSRAKQVYLGDQIVITCSLQRQIVLDNQLHKFG